MISGEQFQKISQISLYTETNDIIENQNNYLEQNLVKISDLEVNEIKKYNYIFVYTHFLEDFFDKFYNHLNDGTVIISHNSDARVDEKFFKYLEGNKIKKWYCQNRFIIHDKLVSLPIGLANSQWPHGNQELIKKVKDLNLKKEILVFKNFDRSTNRDARFHCDNVTSINGIQMVSQTSNEEYWMNIAKSTFVISPPGNGIDCHRIWECLYLRAIPIVLKHEALSQFEDLPILFVDSWDDVTVDFLNSKLPESRLLLKKYYDKKFNNLKVTDIDFWKEIIV